jgi:hypothetical protein
MLSRQTTPFNQLLLHRFCSKLPQTFLLLSINVAQTPASVWTLDSRSAITGAH